MNALLLAQASATTAGTNVATSEPWNWGRVLELHLEKGELVFSLGPVMYIVLVLGVALAWAWKRRMGTNLRHYDVVKYTLKVANIGEVEVVPNTENIRVAYQAWIELTTRKVALPFDEANDVVVEVYSSCYEVFGRLRDLAKSIPAQRLRESKDTRTLVEVMVKVLNEGLRPHLTLWQAKFKRWYSAEIEKPENRTLTPQEIQKKYPEYPALIADLKKVHADVVDYAEFLKQVAQGNAGKQ